MNGPRTHEGETAAQRELVSRRRSVLMVTTFGGFLITFMTSAVNVALPLIQTEFHASAVTLSWVSLAYILAAGAFLLPAGRLADLHGQVRLFLYGMLVFTVFSLASAFAPSIGILIALRAVHGLGLALGMVVAVALVILAHPPESRGRALGLNVTGIYVGLTLGPVLGGLIIHNLGWRSLFLVSGGFGLANVVLVLWRLRGLDRRGAKTARFDVTGTVVFAAALAALLAGFSFVPQMTGVVLMVAGLAGLAGFMWWETRASDPILDAALFRRNRVFAFANTAALINYAATFATVFLLSLYLQYNRGLDAQTAGLILVAGTLVQSFIAPGVGRLADRVKARYLATAGMVVCVFGLFALGFLGLETPYWYVVAVLSVLGVGFAFFSTPITHTVMGSVERRQVTTASAILAMMRLVGQNLSMGIATLVLAVEVGRQTIRPADYPQVLSSVRISFFIFAALCVIGTAASLVGPRRTNVS